MTLSRVMRYMWISMAVCVLVGCATVEKDWQAARTGDSIPSYETFLSEHPESPVSTQARTRLEQLYSERDWDQARKAHTIPEYEAFLQKHPNSEHASKALALVEELRARRDWAETRTSSNVSNVEAFLRNHPDSEYSEQARSLLEKLDAERAWTEAQSEDTVSGYEAFLTKYPNSVNASKAHEKLKQMSARIEWEKIKHSTNIPDFESYLRAYGGSKFFDKALSRLKLLWSDEDKWNAVIQTDTIDAYESFLSHYPQSPYASVAQSRIAEYKADVSGRDIVDALENNRVEVKTRGSGIQSVSVEIRRRVQRPLRVTIPVGTYFVAQGSSQNMVSRKGISVVLDDDEWRTLSVDAACANRPKEVPEPGDRFQIQLSPHQDELKRLMPVLEEARASFGVEQAAVWIVTDDADYADLGSLVQTPLFQPSGGTRMIQEFEAARALQILDSAGIDVTNKAIWRDRDTIVSRLENGPLKDWLKHKAD
ncbi:MAG: outer membrane protein assembly factor BamD [Deltaproteobacteria bacterium]|nr:outer membrane protein assembly factor BamD [Deltaproteobacteria bacterium]